MTRVVTVGRDEQFFEVATHWVSLAGDPEGAKEYLEGFFEHCRHCLEKSGLDPKLVDVVLKSLRRLIHETAEGIERRGFGTLS